MPPDPDPGIELQKILHQDMLAVAKRLDVAINHWVSSLAIASREALEERRILRQALEQSIAAAAAERAIIVKEVGNRMGNLETWRNRMIGGFGAVILFIGMRGATVGLRAFLDLF